MRIFFLAVLICFLFSACKNKRAENQSASSTGNDYNTNGLNNNYDWTGTYELKDKEVVYTLKMHKRSVDGSYEMQFYDNGKNADLYKSSIFDAKDDKVSIYIKYLNNFNMDAKPLGFNSGDTLFMLLHTAEGKDSTVFLKFNPGKSGSMWIKKSDTYN